MKPTKSSLASYIMILFLAGLVTGVMIQFAQAQTNNPNNNQAQILHINMPQKSLKKRILENTSLSYYQMFLGPTASGSTDETYNVFQDGRAPLQSFHAVNLRYQINPKWMVGTSLAATNTYTGRVKNSNGFVNRPGDEFFNARVYVGLPPLKTRIGTFFTNIAYEVPTSVTSRNNDMRYGWVLSESFAFNTASSKWTAGLMGQLYRMVYTNNIVRSPGYEPFGLQTMIVSGGPYASYRFSDKWMLSSLVTFDWDQRGEQTNTTKFNNNLPDRARIGVSYFPSIKYLTSVGLFTQALLKARAETTMLGAELSLRF